MCEGSIDGNGPFWRAACFYPGRDKHVWDGTLQVFVLSVIGNMLPVVPLLLFLEPVSNWLRRYSIFDRFFAWLFARTRRYSAQMDKYGSLGLIPFVAIPLPVTGAWTASAVAFVFGIRCRHAFVAILAGVLIAGVIVTLSCIGVLTCIGRYG